MPSALHPEVISSRTRLTNCARLAAMLERCAHAARPLTRHALRRSELIAKRRAGRARVERLATVVIIACACLTALLIPRLSGSGCGSKVDVTRLKLKLYAYEAFPAWLADNPHRDCPRTLDELGDHMNASDTRDAWGTPLELRCNRGALPGVAGIRVRSAGEDRRFDTGDDLRSSD